MGRVEKCGQGAILKSESYGALIGSYMAKIEVASSGNDIPLVVVVFAIAVAPAPERLRILPFEKSLLRTETGEVLLINILRAFAIPVRPNEFP